MSDRSNSPNEDILPERMTPSHIPSRSPPRNPSESPPRAALGPRFPSLAVVRPSPPRSPSLSPPRPFEEFTIERIAPERLVRIHPPRMALARPPPAPSSPPPPRSPSPDPPPYWERALTPAEREFLTGPDAVLSLPPPRHWDLIQVARPLPRWTRVALFPQRMDIVILPWPHAPGSIVRIYNMTQFKDLATKRQQTFTWHRTMTEALNQQRLAQFTRDVTLRIRDRVVAGLEIVGHRGFNTELTLVRPDNPSIATSLMLYGPGSFDHSRDSLV